MTDRGRGPRRLDYPRVRDHCLGRPGAWPDTPWEDDLVVKVHDRIFAFLGPEDADPPGVGVKCGSGREEADEWLARFPADATPSAYIGRSGWNRLIIGGAIPDEELLEAVDESYRRVVERLPRKHRPEGWDDDPTHRASGGTRP